MFQAKNLKALTFFIFLKCFLFQKFVSQKTAETDVQNGTEDFPFQNLSFALLNTNLTNQEQFILIYSEISYMFFENLPLKPYNISIESAK